MTYSLQCLGIPALLDFYLKIMSAGRIMRGMTPEEEKLRKELHEYKVLYNDYKTRFKKADDERYKLQVKVADQDAIIKAIRNIVNEQPAPALPQQKPVVPPVAPVIPPPATIDPTPKP